MGLALDLLIHAFEEKDLGFGRLSEDPAHPAIEWIHAGNSGFYRMLATDAEDRILQVYALAPFRVPVDLRTRAAELLTWVNYGLRWGAFELDPSDGELRYKSSGLVPDCDVAAEIVWNLYEKGALTMDHFFPLLLRGTFGDGPVDVTYRRLYTALGEGESAPPADVGEILRAIDEGGSDKG